MSEENNELEKLENPIPQDIQTFPITNIPLVEDDDVEEGESVDLGSYDNINVSKKNVYINPETGEQVDPNTLTVAQKLKYIATSLGQTVNDPDPKCKKCYGRGYTGINPDGNIPHVCDCMYKEFYANNPHWRNQQMPSWNRKDKRRHEKQMKKYISSQMSVYKKHSDIVEKSKANLGKNTPGYVPKALREVEQVKEETTTNE